MNVSKDALLILDRNLIMRKKIVGFNLFTMDHDLLLYIPHLLNNKTYEAISILTNVFYNYSMYWKKWKR
jgi:hypothetical protein